MRTHKTREAARELQIHTKTLTGYIRSGAPADTRRDGYRCDPAEIRAWMAATGRDGNPGRPDTGEVAAREQPLCFPCDVARIEPDLLYKMATGLQPIFDRLTRAQMMGMCETWGYAWEMYLSVEMHGDAWPEKPRVPMPAEYWREKFTAHVDFTSQNSNCFVLRMLMAGLDKMLSRATWFALLPADGQAEYAEFLKGMDE